MYICCVRNAEVSLQPVHKFTTLWKYVPPLSHVSSLLFADWYHADALQLEEARNFNLLGFKCNKCRRKGSPKCPHAHPDYKKPEPELLNNGNSNKGTTSDVLRLVHPTSLSSLSGEEDFVTVDDDPLLYSYGIVEPIAEQTLETKIQPIGSGSLSQSQQKLCIRRLQVKHGTNVDGFYATQNANSNCTSS